MNELIPIKKPAAIREPNFPYSTLGILFFAPPLYQLQFQDAAKATMEHEAFKSHWVTSVAGSVVEPLAVYCTRTFLQAVHTLLGGAEFAAETLAEPMFEKTFLRSEFKPDHGIKKPTPGHVYFIANDHSGLVKIGFTTTTPEVRMRGVQTGSGHPLRVMGSFYGVNTDETELHRRFKAKRRAGEWFVLDDELREFIALAIQPQGAN